MSLGTSHGFVSLFNEKTYCDAIVHCGGRSWYVHQAILCKRSEWFTKVFRGYSKEAGTPSIVLQNMPPDQVEWLLRYVYTGRHEFKSFPDYSSNPFVASFQASRLADYFKLECLKSAIAGALWGEIEVFIQPLQNLPYDAVLNAECKKIFGETWDITIFWERFFHGVQLAYTVTAAAPGNNSNVNVDNLRRVFIEFVVRTLHTPQMHPGLLAGLRREARLAADILCAVMENPRSEHPAWNRRSCSHCPRAATDQGLNIARVHHHSALSWTCSDCHIRQLRNAEKRERERAEREQMEEDEDSQSEGSLDGVTLA